MPSALQRFPSTDAVIDRAPVGQTTEATVIDEEVGLELTREATSRGIFLGEITVDGVELHSPIPAPLDGFIEELALADRPENESMPLAYEHPKSLGSEGEFFTYLGVSMAYDRAIEVYSYDHRLVLK